MNEVLFVRYWLVALGTRLSPGLAFFEVSRIGADWDIEFAVLTVFRFVRAVSLVTGVLG